MLEALLSFLMFITAIFLILLILVQRGRGGGLAGVFGGPGGQSAFGAKAGDLFTRITIGVVAFWILLCIVTIRVVSRQNDLFGETGGSSTPNQPVQQRRAFPEAGQEQGDSSGSETSGSEDSNPGNPP
ncbi:MAG: preprotein translocase subunit SecG [Thermoguttaceae bacterium]|nr:preprotein translocase subunit SecG [Thermoguttaceae bacterium]MDW8037526.1 preprotein translocase subunit SecG [Thermoguttaceae bacterium]